MTPTKSEPLTIEALMDHMYLALGIIANASDWGIEDDQAREWVQAAERWRDEYHAMLRTWVERMP